MKKLTFLVAIVALAYGVILQQGDTLPGLSLQSKNSVSTIQNAYNNRNSDLQVQGEGVVLRVLPDDLDGSRHQRFILKLSTGLSLLIAHNIDLAPRINNLKTGDMVNFYGEYEWNKEGGVIHWTHRDPSNRHVGGWLKHDGKTYQ